MHLKQLAFQLLLSQPLFASATRPISSKFPYAKQFIEIEEGTTMAYVDTRPENVTSAYPPVVFMHGVPTSSYMWRNVIPYAEGSNRVLAPDLVGFGNSSKLPYANYTWEDHQRYVEEFFDLTLGPTEQVVLVLHDFGSLFGFNWAFTHQDRIAGLVFLEWHAPMPSRAYIGTTSQAVTDALFTGGTDHIADSVLNHNDYIELFIPDQVIRNLSNAEMDHYRAPFPDSDSREGILATSKLFPVTFSPPDVYAAVVAYNDWLLENEIPKLFFYAEPGKLINGTDAEYYKANLKNSVNIDAGAAKHFVPEDQPFIIGEGIAKWLQQYKLGESK